MISRTIYVIKSLPPIHKISIKRIKVFIKKEKLRNAINVITRKHMK